MPNMATRSFDPKVLEVHLAEVAMERINVEGVWDQCVDKKDPSVSPLKYAIETHEFYGLGAMQTRGETTEVGFDSPVAGQTKRSVYFDLGLAVAFSRNLYQDELWGVIEDVVRSLGDAYPLTCDLFVGQLYDYAYTNTFYTAPDGQPLFGTHTYGTVTSTNCLGTPADFSYTSAKLARLALRKRKSARGFRNGVKGDKFKVLMPPDIEDTFDKTVGARGEPDTTSLNNPNVLSRTNWQKVVNETLVNTRQWALLDPSETGIWFVVREAPVHDSWIEKGNKSYVFDMIARLGIHIKTHRNVYGSGILA